MVGGGFLRIGVALFCSENGWHGHLLMPVFARMPKDTGLNTCACHPEIFRASRAFGTHMKIRSTATSGTRPRQGSYCGPIPLSRTASSQLGADRLTHLRGRTGAAEIARVILGVRNDVCARLIDGLGGFGLVQEIQHHSHA